MADPATGAPGTLGHLTAEQTEKLQDLWIRLSVATDQLTQEDKEHLEKADPKKNSSYWNPTATADKTFGPDKLRKSLHQACKIEHPDSLLLRFLRARKWDIEKAQAMIVAALKWRIDEMHLDSEIMPKGEEGAWKDSRGSDPHLKKEGEGFAKQLTLGKSWHHGLDKSNHLMSVVRTRLHRPKDQTETSLQKFTVWNIETARLTLDKGIETGTLVFDLTGFGLSNMDYSSVKFLITCFEANFPESLHKIVVYNSPFVFWGIWSLIKGWIDPVVASKITFISGAKDFEKNVADKEEMAVELGGTDGWTWEYTEPVEGENAKMEDTATRDKLYNEREELWTKFEQVTKDWIKGDESKVAERERLAKELKIAYCKLDPYIRARSIYDRTGLVNLEALQAETEKELTSGGSETAAAPIAA